MNISKIEQRRIEREESAKTRPCVEFNKLSEYTGDIKPYIFCLEDNQNSLMTIDSFPRWYLQAKFNMTLREYYDKWYKKPGEGICVVCGKPTNFSRCAYNRTCSKTCSRKDPAAHAKISESFKYRDVVAECNKRKSTNLTRYGVEFVAQVQEFKDKSVQTCLDRYGCAKDFSNPEHRAKAAIVLERDKEIINEKRRNSWTEEKKAIAKMLREQTLMDEHGVINVRQLPSVIAKTDDILEQQKLTWFLKYSKTNPMKVDEIVAAVRNTNELSGRWTTIEAKPKMLQYRILVIRETRKHINKLFENWDGLDFYTKQPLVSNADYIVATNGMHPNTNPMQPSIDHKISVKNGFMNNIPVAVIGGIDNLAIVSKSTNSAKGSMNTDEYMLSRGLS